MALRVGPRGLASDKGRTWLGFWTAAGAGDVHGGASRRVRCWSRGGPPARGSLARGQGRVACVLPVCGLHGLRVGVACAWRPPCGD